MKYYWARIIISFVLALFVGAFGASMFEVIAIFFLVRICFSLEMQEANEA